MLVARVDTQGREGGERGGNFFGGEAGCGGEGGQFAFVGETGQGGATRQDMDDFAPDAHGKPMVFEAHAAFHDHVFAVLDVVQGFKRTA